MSNDEIQYDLLCDCTGLACPLPILRAKKALTQLKRGQILKVIATDPGAVEDFRAFSNITENKLINIIEQQDQFIFHIKKN